ncbi:MAG: hypothetical protein NZM43_04205 [Saprospiraceae bacterium]|nr:hypothetical protein [Saprospiraceae bacterium]MDW8483510.1 hypothetical protein [Saprospiraceae bacterium]
MTKKLSPIEAIFSRLFFRIFLKTHNKAQIPVAANIDTFVYAIT